MGDRETALAQASLAERQLAAGEYGPALEGMLSALRLAPAIDRLWVQFGDLVRFFNFRHPAEPVREPLARALEHPAVDPGDLVRPIPASRFRIPRVRSRSRSSFG